jgi:predicted acyltransferase
MQAMIRTATIKTPRLLSLDVLRGATVAVMVLVNNAGDGSVSYAQLRHSVWNGCTLTDVVFPLFLFIVGSSIALSFSARRQHGDSRSAIARQMLRRALTIFALGLLLNALPHFNLGELRYYGVLQRIALCYVLAGAVYLFGGAAACAVASVAALVGYWLLLTHVPVPGFGVPGASIEVLDRYGNLAAWLDRSMVPQAHLYRHSFYDPEGLLSTLPALANTFFGVLSAVWLRSARPAWQRASALMACGLASMAGGLLWAGSFPLNKRLWTSSFALFTAGIAMALLALLFWYVDVRKKQEGRLNPLLKPWLVFGTNALTAYVLSEVLAVVLAAIPVRSGEDLQQLLFRLLPSWLGPPPFVSMLYSILFVCVCYLPVWELYRRRIFLKL